MIALSDALIYGFLLAVGVLMIVAGLLPRVGITWFSPRTFKRPPLPSGATLLLGAGFVVMSVTHLIPADHQPAWAVMMTLKSLTLGLFLASLLLFVTSARKIWT
jgi:uncharacterized membrane protein SirB2